MIWPMDHFTKLYLCPSRLLSKRCLPIHHGKTPMPFAFPELSALSRCQLRGTHQKPSEQTKCTDERKLHKARIFEDSHQSSKAHSSEPWYLQIDSPLRDETPLLDRQKLPELPSFPPPLLQPVLTYISQDLGLNDLTLLDLRHLDPPSALGANLLMILGTARSEKHLHVSAERFCRWLRDTYQLIASADGLLGRGELKLKLRRKMRRARLLSRVGSSEIAITDDGIRTGWICLSIRHLPNDHTPSMHSDLQNDYVGFGADPGTVTVIIQMLTQEKREDLDLENLWDPASKSASAREGNQADYTGLQEQVYNDSDVEREPEYRSEVGLSDPRRTPHSLLKNSLGQVRSYHDLSQERPRRFIIPEGLFSALYPKPVCPPRQAI